MSKLFLCLLLIGGLLSCKGGNSKINLDTSDSTDLKATVQSEDEGMNRAIDSAKASYAGFLQHLPGYLEDTGKLDLGVKVRFAFGTEGSGEHMWLTELHYKKDKLYGILSGTPDNLTDVKTGDTIEIKPDMVSDWMYIEKGRLVGGYTIKEFYDRMSAKDRARMEEEMGARIR